MVILETLKQPSIENKQVNNVQIEEEWFSPIKEFIRLRNVPQNKLEAKKLKIKAVRNAVMMQLIKKNKRTQMLRKILCPFLVDLLQGLGLKDLMNLFSGWLKNCGLSKL